jgi:dsDNA-specific endonuclease/ATPase MutS2
MTQTGQTVTYSLETVLERIERKIDDLQKDTNQKFDTLQKEANQKFDTLQKEANQKFDTLQKEANQKFDTLQKDMTDFKVGQAKLTEKVDAMDKRLEKLEIEQTVLVKDISDLKGFKSLILPAIVAVLSAIVTVGLRAFFLGNNP